MESAGSTAEAGSQRSRGLLVLGVSAALVTSCLFLAWRFFRTRSSPHTQTTAKLEGVPHEILDRSGLYYLGADYTYSSSASYALKTSSGIAVIDPGLRFSMLQASFDLLGLDVADVRLVLVTHRHADHWFAASELVKLSGATVIAHSNEAGVLTEAADLGQYYSCYPTEITDVPILENVVTVQDGETVRLGQVEFKVIATPGHTPGSACYLAEIQGKKVLWSGDTVLTLNAGSFGGDYMTRIGPRFGGNMTQYLASFRKLHALDIDILLPGHPAYGQRADPVIGDGQWKMLLQPTITRLERWLKDYRSQAELFLDGTPKQLTDEIVYLGEATLTASYVLRTPAGDVCVDPGRRSPEELTRLLGELELDALDLRAVLITTAHPDHYAGAAELCASSGAQLITGPIPADQRALIQPDRMLGAQDTLRVGETTITALDSGAGNMSYLVRVSDQWVLFGGDNIARFPLRPAEEYHEHTVTPNLNKEAEFYRQLRMRSLSWLLPAHPRYDESPFYLPGEWEMRTRRF